MIADWTVSKWLSWAGRIVAAVLLFSNLSSQRMTNQKRVRRRAHPLSRYTDLIGASRGRHQCVLAGHLARALERPECQAN